MKIRFLCAVGACLTGAALGLAQAPAFKPARSFTFDTPAAPPVAPRRSAPPAPLPAPVQAVHKEVPRPAVAPVIKPASVVVYQQMPSDAAVQQPLPVSLPVEQFHDVVGPVTVTDPHPSGIVDGGVYEEGALPAVSDGRCAWVAVDALIWWMKDSPVTAPLVTQGTSAGRGVLGQPDTTFLAGSNADLDAGQLNGGRITFGVWVNDAVALELGGFYLGKDGTSLTHTASPNVTGADVVLARPFFDVNTGQENALVVAAPNFADGRFDLTYTSQLWGTELNTHLAAYNCLGLRIGMIGGARFLNLEENLIIRSTSALQGAGTLLIGGVPVGAPSSLTLSDRFNTRNRWFGGQIGIESGVECGRLFFNSSFKVGGGINKQQLIVQGSTTDGNIVDNGGLLALPSNIGTFGKNRGSFLNEVMFETGFRINECVAVSAGYTFLYLTGVVRPGSQIDRGINGLTIPSQAPFNALAVPQAPVRRMDQTDFWAQGVQMGLTVRY